MHSSQRPYLVFITTAVLLLSGCASSPIVGKWQGNIRNIPLIMDFKSDKTFTQTANTPIGTVTANGTYTLEKDQLSLTPTGVTAPGLPAQFLAQAKQQMGKAQTVTSAFTNNNDTLSWTKGSLTITMTRMKEAK